MIDWKVQLFQLNFGKEEAQAVQSVLDSRWLTMGEKTRDFEMKFSEFLGGNVFSKAVANGTAALHMALLALNIGPGDEVIIPSLTFIADMNVVKMVGATPVPADIESLDHWNMSTRTIREKITEKTKAVQIVHYAGYPCDMDEIIELCKEKNLLLIKDAAHAPGATYKGRACGTMGDIGCFSFYSNKNLSLGEGGMVTTKSGVLAEKLGYLRSHGMTTLSFERHKGRAISYDVAQPGLNYRIDEIRSAIGLVQLAKLNNMNSRRAELDSYYRIQLKESSEVTIPFCNEKNSLSSYHIFPILLDSSLDRVNIINSMKGDRIQSSIHYPSFNDFSMNQDSEPFLTPLADTVSERELTLPLYPDMTHIDVDLVVNALKKAIQENR